MLCVTHYWVTVFTRAMRKATKKFSIFSSHFFRHVCYSFTWLSSFRKHLVNMIGQLSVCSHLKRYKTVNMKSKEGTFCIFFFIKLPGVIISVLWWEKLQLRLAWCFFSFKLFELPFKSPHNFVSCILSFSFWLLSATFLEHTSCVSLKGNLQC